MINSAYVLIQSCRAPYSSSYPIDALEAAFAATNMGLELRFVFVGEGVLQLIQEQGNTSIAHKSIFKKLGALPLFDIEKIYVQSTALSKYNVSIPQSMPNIETVSDAKLASLCQYAQHVLVF